MNYSVLLIQRGISATTHPVSGKSGHLYGNAIASAEHKGVIFKLSLDQYMAHAHDLIGNTLGAQQWVPEFISEAPSVSHPRGKCDRCPKPATAKWQSHLFCDEHAPNNAEFFDGRAPAATGAVSAPVIEPRLAQDVRPKLDEPTELPQEQMAAPSIGTARENVGQPAVTEPVVVPPPAAAAPQPPVASPPPPAAEAPKARPAVEVITEAVVEKVIGQLDNRIQSAVSNALTNALASLPATATETRIPAKKTPRNAPKADEKPLSDFQVLQKKAKSLKINSFGKTKAQLEAAIADKEKPPTEQLAQ
jgi:hypothetical protein